jgi:hypothetical protein
VLSTVSLTAFDDSGIPDFRALHFNRRDDVRSVWALDLLYLMARMCACCERPMHQHGDRAGLEH